MIFRVKVFDRKNNTTFTEEFEAVSGRDAMTIAKEKYPECYLLGFEQVRREAKEGVKI